MNCQIKYSPNTATHLLFLALLAFVALPINAASCQQKPNIILINLDDADTELFELPNSARFFPNITKLRTQGTSFTNFHVTTPICGPSRACLYRGQYAHNTGIYVNQTRKKSSHNFDGGFKYYRQRGFFLNDLSTWMNTAGYRTMMVGKFLHHDFQPYVPPGWDDFYSYQGGRYYGPHRFTTRISDNGKVDPLHPNLYRTTAETRDAISLINLHAERGGDQPFFLNINPLGPHRAQSSHPEMVDRNRTHWWTRLSRPFSRAYNEVDISDKQGHFKGLPELPAWAHGFIQTHFRERVLATRSVDDMVGEVMQTLRDQQLDQNTYVFVTSDNGFLLGHHRTMGKGLPVDRATRVPLIVVGPNVPQGRVADQLIGHIDLAPTFVDLGQGTVPNLVDGMSFAELLTEQGLRRNPVFRNSLLIENWSTITNFGTAAFAASTTLRLPKSVYTEWANGDRDFYDLRDDPDQLENSYPDLPFAEQVFLESFLRTLKNPDHRAKARFSVPYLDAQTIPKNAELSGLAEDPIGVKRVSLLIQNLRTRQYWNGTNWQQHATQLGASLDNPDGQITFWRYQLPTSLSQQVSDDLVAWVWAFDENLDRDQPSRITFHFDEEPPEFTVSSPKPGNEIDGRTVYLGTVQDNLENPSIQILIRDTRTNLFWNGHDFQNRKFFIEVKPNRQGDWRYRSSIPSGQYATKVQAIDSSGTLSERSVGMRFSVK